MFGRAGLGLEVSPGLGMGMVPFGSEGSALAPSTCRGAVPPALSLQHPRDSSEGQG